MREREKNGELTCSVREILPDIFQFSNAPQIGIGSSGYLIVRETGNIAFEAAGFHTQNALGFIAEKGGIDFLSSSHPHGFGALWQLQREFRPRICAFQREAVQFTKALDVNFVFDDELQIDENTALYHVGGHYEGQSVLHLKREKLLFCGDALKVDADADGRAVGISCHKAFHKQIPLSKREIEKYREVIVPLEFTAVCTPFEFAPDATNDDARRLFDLQLAAAQTSAAPIALKR